MSNARSRIAKLEAAMVAVGESDPTYPSLFDEQSASRRGGRVQENELSALRSGQVGVPQTEPDSSEADAIQFLRVEEEARGSG